jgi:hypothetical protein
MTSNPNPTTGAFVLKMKTPKWRLCVVKQAPDEPASSWMLFGQPKCNKSKSNHTTFQMEFKPHQETTLIKHLVNLGFNDDDEACAELRLVMVAESPAISCIESLWSLKGLEMYRTKPSSLCIALHQCVHMLSFSPQTQSPQTQPQTQQPQHPMQTRSRKH